MWRNAGLLASNERDGSNSSSADWDSGITTTKGHVLLGAGFRSLLGIWKIVEMLLGGHGFEDEI